MKLDELKEKLEIDVLYRIKPTDIKVGVLNFATGCINEYNFTAEFVYKIPYGSDGTLLKNQVVYVLGVTHYESGNSYNGKHKLSYTDDEELEKIGESLDNAERLDEKQFDYYSITKKFF